VPLLAPLPSHPQPSDPPSPAPSPPQDHGRLEARHLPLLAPLHVPPQAVRPPSSRALAPAGPRRAGEEHQHGAGQPWPAAPALVCHQGGHGGERGGSQRRHIGQMGGCGGGSARQGSSALASLVAFHPPTRAHLFAHSQVIHIHINIHIIHIHIISPHSQVIQQTRKRAAWRDARAPPATPPIHRPPSRARRPVLPHPPVADNSAGHPAVRPHTFIHSLIHTLSHPPTHPPPTADKRRSSSCTTP
jgi:hypothetical protein